MLTIIIALIPAALIRWALLRRPISKGAAIGIAAAVWLLVLLLLIGAGAKGQSAGAIAAPAALISFFILRSGAVEKKEEQ